MGMPRELTREDLEEMGITDVDINGEYVIGKYGEYSYISVSQRHPNGHTKTYLYVGPYSKKTKNNQLLAVHRVVYAWYKGKARANMDIAHLDDNPFNNRLDNLKEMSRGENNRMKKWQANQFARYQMRSKR